MVRRLVFGLVRLLLFAAAVGLAAVTALGELGRTFHILDTLNHFRPFYLAAAAALLLAIAVVNNGRVLRRTSFWLAFIAVTLQAIHVVPELVASAAASSLHSGTTERREVLRIVTFNVWGGNRRPEAAVAALRRLDADVIVVQEAYEAQKGLVGLISRTHPHTVGCVAVSRCNVAIFSRHRLLRRQVRRPEGTGAERWTVPVVRADLEVETARGPIGASLIATHLTWPTYPQLQRRQMEQVSAAAREAPATETIVLGDFNSTPWSYGLAELGRLLELRRVTLALPTWPAEQMPRPLLALSRLAAEHGFDTARLQRPFLPLDHAFIGRSHEVKAIRRAAIPGSDHFAVVLDVVASPAAQTAATQPHAER